ncbi:MAG: hypothetical protein WB791_07055 [Waddliaceae bacterium]
MSITDTFLGHNASIPPCENHLPLTIEKEKSNSNQRCAGIARDQLNILVIKGKSNPQYQVRVITQEECRIVKHPSIKVFSAPIRIQSPSNAADRNTLEESIVVRSNGLPASKRVETAKTPISSAHLGHVATCIEAIESWIQWGVSSEQSEEITQHAKRLLEQAISASEEEVGNVLLRLQTVPTPENAKRISSPSLYVMLLDVMMAYFDRAMMLEDPTGVLTVETRKNYRQVLGRWDDESAFLNRFGALQSVAIYYRHEYLNESFNHMTDQTQWRQDLHMPLSDALTKLSGNNPLGLKKIYSIVQKYWGKSWYPGILVVRALTHYAVHSEATLNELKAFLGDIHRDDCKNWRLIYAGSMALAHVMIHSADPQVRQQAWNTDGQALGFAYWVDIFCRRDSLLHKNKAAADSFLAAFFKLCDEVQGTCLDKTIKDAYVKLESTCRRFNLFDLLDRFSQHPLRSPTQLNECFPPKIPLVLPSPVMTFPDEKAMLPEDAAQIHVPAIEEALAAYLEDNTFEQKREALKRWCTLISQCRQAIWMHTQKLHRWVDLIQQTLKNVRGEHHALKSDWKDFTNRHNCSNTVRDLGILHNMVEKMEQADAYEALDRLIDELDEVPCPIDPEFLQTIIKHSHRLASQLLEQAAQKNAGRYTATDVYRRLRPVMARLTGDQQVQFLQEVGDCYCQAPLSADTIATAAAYYYQAWVLSESNESPPLALQQRLPYILALRCFVALSRQAKQQQGTEEIARLLPLFHQIEIFRRYLKNKDDAPSTLRARFLTLDQQLEEETVLPLVRKAKERHFQRLQDLQPMYGHDKVDKWNHYCQQLFPLIETWQCHQTVVGLVKSYYQKIVASCKDVHRNAKECASKIKKRANDQIRHIVSSDAITVADDALDGFLSSVDLNFWQHMHQEWKSEQHTFRETIKSRVKPADALRRYADAFQAVLSACLQYCTKTIGRSHEGAYCLFHMDTSPYTALLTDEPLTIALLTESYQNADYWEDFCRCFAMLVHVITGHRMQLHYLGQAVSTSKQLIGPPDALAKVVVEATADKAFERLAHGLALTAVQPCIGEDDTDSLWRRYQAQLGYTIADDEKKATRQEKAIRCLQALGNHYPDMLQSGGPAALTWLLAWLRAIAWYHGISADDPFALIKELSQHTQSLLPANDRQTWMIHPDFLQDMEHALAQVLQEQAETLFDAEEDLEEKISYVPIDRDSHFLVFDLGKDILAPAYRAISRCRDTADPFDPVWDPLEKELQRMIQDVYPEHIRLQTAIKKTDDAIKQLYFRSDHQQLADKCAREMALKNMLNAGDPRPFVQPKIDDSVHFLDTYFATILREVLQVNIRRTHHRDFLSRVDAHLSVYRRLPPPLRALYCAQLDDLLKTAQKKDRPPLEHLRYLLLNTPDPDGSRPCHALGHPDNPFAGWHRKMQDIIQAEPPAELKTPIEVQWYDPYRKCFEKGYLKAVIQAQLINEQSMRFDKERRPARCQIGQRVVIPLRFTGNDASPIDAYAKELPEMPLMQYQVQMLTQRISGIALPVTLCRFAPEGKTPYSVLFSEPVEATLLDHMVSEWQSDQPRLKDGGDLTAVESQLSGYYFTLKFFEHILMRFDDAQFANMGTVACTTPDNEQKLCLIEIDADHAFADSVALYADEKEPDELRHRANVKTCLYTFQHALNTVDKQAVALFLSLDPKAVLIEWLKASDRLHEAYLSGAVKQGKLHRGLFQKDAKKLYANNQSYVGCVTHETLALSVYQRWRQLQRLLKMPLDNLTLWDVLEEMEPQLVDFYPHPSTHKNPFVRFKEARLAYREFSLKEADDEKNKQARRITQPYFTTTSSSEKQLSRCLDRRVHKQNQSFGYKVRHLGESEAVRLSHHIGNESHMIRPKQLIRHLIAFDQLYERVEVLKKEISKVYAGETKIFNTLPSPELLLSSMSMTEMFRVIVVEVAEKFPNMADQLRALRVKKLFKERQQLILAAITPEQYWQCQKLKFSGFTALTENQLKTILSYCPGLISLDISGSEELIYQGEKMQLSANVIDQLSRYCQYLHYLNSSRLPNMDIIEQFNLGRYVGVSMPPVDFPRLEDWVMENSPVRQIKIAAPCLQRISLLGCEQLIQLETGSAQYAALEDTINFPDIDLSAVAFGKNDWERYFGDVGEEPPLPADIRKILNRPCPFWKGKRVQDTHLLTLIHKSVDGRPLTLNSLEELIQRPLGGGHATKYRYYWDGIKKEFGDRGVERSYWVLMTKDVLEGSRDKSYDEQRVLVEEHAKRTGLPYEMPHALEAAVSILMHHAKTEERLYTNEPWTYTRCQEKYCSKWPLVVGGFFAMGVGVGYYGAIRHKSDGFSDSRGVAGVRKLCVSG